MIFFLTLKILFYYFKVPCNERILFLKLDFKGFSKIRVFRKEVYIYSLIEHLSTERCIHKKFYFLE